MISISINYLSIYMLPFSIFIYTENEPFADSANMLIYA